MTNYAITIKSLEKEGVLDDITKLISSFGINIVYAHLFVEKNSYGSINLELENVEDIDSLIESIGNIKEVQNIEIHGSSKDIFGKRIIILGGGAQVSQVALGAITEADRHNIRGERISIDTLPVVGENEIAEAIGASSSLPRVSAIVLAGSLMGGNITKVVQEIKENYGLIIISLNMPGGVSDIADLIVTDPIQAGVMAVMAIADTAVFDIKKLKHNKKF